MTVENNTVATNFFTEESELLGKVLDTVWQLFDTTHL